VTIGNKPLRVSDLSIVTKGIVKGRRAPDERGPSAAVAYQSKMMSHRNTILTGCLALALTSVLHGQNKYKSTLLPESEAQQLTQLCSRPGPPKFDSAWKPAEGDIHEMETKLSRVSRLRSGCCRTGLRIERPELYFRQYVGIMVANRKLIYINAFCDDKPPTDWQERIVDVCDGGCSWGVIYDIATGKFSDLTINGVG
jgi:hypothetical protein